MTSIVYQGVTIWDDSASADPLGIGYQFRDGGGGREVIAKPASVGTGYWLKRGNEAPREHQLEVDWRASAPSDVGNMLRQVTVATAGSLVIPEWGTINNCVLQPVGNVSTQRTENGYLVRATLTFVEYP